MKRFSKFSKKGTTILIKQLIEIVIFTILFFLVLALIYAVWSAFSVDQDTQTVKSFEDLAKAIESKTKSAKPYDSVRMNLYLKDGYEVFMFENSADDARKRTRTISVSGGGKCIGKPDVCKNDACICLYKGEAEKSCMGADRNKNVLSCKTFAATFFLKEYELEDRFINDDTRESQKTGDAQQFYNLIVSKNRNAAAKTGSENEISVVIATEAAIKKDLKMNTPTCIPLDPQRDALCENIRRNDRIETSTMYDAVQKACKVIDSNSKAITAQCSYDENTGKCQLVCDTFCDTIKSCADYAKLSSGVMVAQDIGFASCEEDICEVSYGLSACSVDELPHLACSDTVTGEIKTSDGSYKCEQACIGESYLPKPFDNFASGFKENYDATKCDDLVMFPDMYKCTSEKKYCEEIYATLKQLSKGAIKRIDAEGQIYVSYIADPPGVDALTGTGTKAAGAFSKGYTCTGPEDVDVRIESFEISPEDLTGNTGSTCKKSSETYDLNIATHGVEMIAYDCAKDKPIHFKVGVANDGYEISLQMEPKLLDTVNKVFVAEGEIVSVDHSSSNPKTTIDMTLPADTPSGSRIQVVLDCVSDFCKHPNFKKNRWVSQQIIVIEKS